MPESPPPNRDASDEPALRKVGLYKRWGRDAAGDTVRLDG